jgi:hypothetical protein
MQKPGHRSHIKKKSDGCVDVHNQLRFVTYPGSEATPAVWRTRDSSGVYMGDGAVHVAGWHFFVDARRFRVQQEGSRVISPVSLKAVVPVMANS